MIVFNMTFLVIFQVKLIVSLKGRENEFKNNAIELMQRFRGDVGEVGHMLSSFYYFYFGTRYLDTRVDIQLPCVPYTTCIGLYGSYRDNFFQRSLVCVPCIGPYEQYRSIRLI